MLVQRAVALLAVELSFPAVWPAVPGVRGVLRSSRPVLPVVLVVLAV